MNQVDRLAERTRKLAAAIQKNKDLSEDTKDRTTWHLNKIAEQLEAEAAQIPPKLNE